MTSFGENSLVEVRDGNQSMAANGVVSGGTSRSTGRAAAPRRQNLAIASSSSAGAMDLDVSPSSFAEFVEFIPGRYSPEPQTRSEDVGDRTWTSEVVDEPSRLEGGAPSSSRSLLRKHIGDTDVRRSAR